jgi:hypothetical protein
LSGVGVAKPLKILTTQSLPIEDCAVGQNDQKAGP